jgi:hypothetical protein
MYRGETKPKHTPQLRFQAAKPEMDQFQPHSVSMPHNLVHKRAKDTLEHLILQLFNTLSFEKSFSDPKSRFKPLRWRRKVYALSHLCRVFQERSHLRGALPQLFRNAKQHANPFPSPNYHQKGSFELR